MSYKFNPFTDTFDLVSAPGVSGIGDVIGPASATDEAIARFDGATGKLIQNGGNALLDDSGNTRLGGYIHVGSLVAPANTTAGDITGTRLAVGDNSAFSSATGAINKIKGEMTDTSGGAKYGIFSQVDVNNASASSSEFRALGMTGQIKAGNTNNVGTLIGLFSETRVFGNSTTSSLIGYRAFGTVVPSTTELSGKTISSVVGFDTTGFKISGTPPNAATITTVKGINVNNNDSPSPIGITNTIGLDVGGQTRGSSLNVGIRVAASSGGTNNFAIQLSDTGGTAAGGITFGTDTNVYRVAANVLASDDSLRLLTYLRVGSVAAPTNTTAGDFTCTRLKVGDGAFGTGVDFSVTGDGALSGFLNVGSETAPANTTAGDLTFIRGFMTGNLTITDANVVLGTTTGTKVGTDVTQKLGFWNATPVAQNTGWTTSNVTPDKALDADATTLDEVADVLCTLIEQLKTYGLLGA